MFSGWDGSIVASQNGEMVAMVAICDGHHHRCSHAGGMGSNSSGRSSSRGLELSGFSDRASRSGAWESVRRLFIKGNIHRHEPEPNPRNPCS